MKKPRLKPDRSSMLVLMSFLILLIPFQVKAQSDSNVLDFKINYSPEPVGKSKIVMNTLEVIFDKELVKDAGKYYIKVARITNEGAQDIFQKVIDIKDEQKHFTDSNENEVILNDHELILIVRNVPNDRYEVFLRIDTLKGEIYKGWREIEISESVID